jgi:hypothetical protein
MHAASGGQPFQGEKEVGVVYLQKGIRWIPDYRIELLEGGKARLLLQGTVINELADMDNADLRLVVGVPNFLMKDELSPMALREVGLRLSSYFAPPGGRAGGRRDLYLSNVMMSQAAAEVGERGAPAGGPNIPSEGQLEDLYLYRKSGLTLKKGESAVLKLLEVTVPYEDVYTWDVPPLPPLEMWRYVNSDEQRTALQKLSGAKALHKIRLLNTGDTPWTTGPAAIFRAGLPLGQDLLSFTSVKNKADVTVTTATDLNTKKEETEVGRQENSIRISGDAYTKVSLHGKLTVTNFKDRDIRLELTRKAIGKATAASADGRITALNAVEDKSTADEWGLPLWQSWPYWWFAANPLSSIAWEAVIPAGQTATFEYDLYYYYHP